MRHRRLQAGVMNREGLALKTVHDLAGFTMKAFIRHHCFISMT
jgi:hypothetical protein